MRRLALLAVLAGGCTLHFGGDDTGDDDCLYGRQADRAELQYLIQLVNPETLVCEDFTGGGGSCNPTCGPCPEPDGMAPLPTWGDCNSPCRALNEGACLDAVGCRLAYDWGCYTGDGPCTLEDPFLGCYPVDQTGPVSGGVCDGLDSWTCSQHDDCAALHTEQCYQDGTCYWQFRECIAQTPEARGTCYGEVLCDSMPPGCPPDSRPGILGGCWSGYCIPVDECEPPPPPPA